MEKTKAQLRKDYLEKRKRLDPAERIQLSAAIRQRVMRDRRWEEARTVLVYVSFSSEVETQKLIQEALEQNKRIVVPVAHIDTLDMTFSELRSLGDLHPGPYKGIYEPSPEHRRMVDPAEIELVLVPGVVFDRTGGRIGMGGGYFDKALARMPNAVRLGLSFGLQLSEALLPLMDHDIRMHAIATEDEMIEIS